MVFSLIRCVCFAVPFVVLFATNAEACRRRRCCCQPAVVCAVPAPPAVTPPTDKPAAKYPERKLPPLEDRGELIDPADLLGGK